jgi:hypothetical protein
MNAKVAGELRVVILKAGDQPKSGREMAVSLPVQGDSVRHLVRWKDTADLKRFAGKAVRLRLVAREANIFAFRFH